MATEIKSRRGTEAQHDDGSGFTGAEGELTVDTTNGTAGETDQFNFQTQLFKNGSLVASSPTATSQGQAAQINTHDIAVSIGDTLVVKLEQTGGTGARTVSVESNCEVYVASSTVPFAETITT